MSTVECVVRRVLFLSMLVALLSRVGQAKDELLSEVTIGVENPIAIKSSRCPSGFSFDSTLGLLKSNSIDGQVVHIAKEGVRGLFETRAVRTPKGDLLLMFPEGNHYAAAVTYTHLTLPTICSV